MWPAFARQWLWIGLLVGGCSGEVVTPPKPDGGADGGTDAGTNWCATAPHPTLSDVFGRSFSSQRPTTCSASGCHATGAGGMTFSTPAELWAATVNKAAMGDPMVLRIKPGDPGASLFFQRLLPEAPARMPLGGPYLDDVALAELAGWICDGAPLGTPLAISGFAPSSGSIGTVVTLSGSGFSPIAADHLVEFNGVAAPVRGVDGGTLETEVPPDAGSGMIAVTLRGLRVTTATPFTVISGNPVPTLTQATPASAPVGSADTVVQLVGARFLATSQARLDGAAIPTTFVSATRLDVTLTAADLGMSASHQLTVFSPAPGGGNSNALSFDVTNPIPTLAAISPASVGTGGAPFTLSLSGTNFNSSSSVHFNGNPVPTAFVSSTALTAQLPTIATAGSSAVTVVNPAPGGGTSGARQLQAVVITTPTITGLSPNPAIAGSPVVLGVSGSNYDCTGAQPRVLFNAGTLTATSCTATTLSVSIPATAAGSYPVQVRNPNNDLSNTVSLVLQTPNPAPTLGSLAPATASTGASGFTLTAGGTGFVSGAVLSFNGVARPTTFASATQVSAAIPGSDLAVAGTFPVVITNPAPGGGASNSLGFAVVTANPVPTISALSPTSLGIGSGAATVTITGTGFVASSSATFSGSARPTTFSSATQLAMALTAADTQTGGIFPVTVVTPAPGGGTSGALNLVIGNPVPAISALSPCGRVAGSGQVTVQLTGTGFVSTSTVTFNGTSLAVVFGSATQLTATIPAALIATAPAGNAANVVVSNPTPGGGSSAPATFGVASATVTLAANVQPLFTANCTNMGCHTGAAPAAALTLTSGNALANLVGVPSSGCAGKVRVQGCAPSRAQSVLIDKILATGTSPPCAGFAMPKGAPLNAAEKQLLVNWVAQGAPP